MGQQPRVGGQPSASGQPPSAPPSAPAQPPSADAPEPGVFPPGPKPPGFRSASSGGRPSGEAAPGGGAGLPPRPDAPPGSASPSSRRSRPSGSLWPPGPWARPAGPTRSGTGPVTSTPWSPPTTPPPPDAAPPAPADAAPPPPAPAVPPPPTAPVPPAPAAHPAPTGAVPPPPLPPTGAVPSTQPPAAPPSAPTPPGTPSPDGPPGAAPPSSPAVLGASAGTAVPEPSDARPGADVDPRTLQAQEVRLVTGSQPVHVDHVGSGPPTYDPEPTALPPADPDDLGDLVADTVLDGARYGTCTVRAVSLRGDSSRYRGEPRRDSLLTARFGVGEQALVLVAMATGVRATPGAHRAAAEACRWIGQAIGRSHARLVEDIRAARRGDLKSGLHRLTDRSLGRLRASAVEQGLDPEEYTASLRCLLLPADPRCRTRVFFGVGPGGLFRLRGGEWQDIEPRVAEAAGAPVVGFGSLPHETPEGDRLTMDLGITTPPSPYEPAPAPPREPFRFRASVAREGDVLLLCTPGLADPLRGEEQLADHLAARWRTDEPPGLAAYLADTQVRVKGYADDRTAAAVWEA
ncbi:protein phosphatase 2C domain-containing protein [Streptomyces sp. JV178]|uniref:protein phosphatase 2C domain-containing protein n=1 Tax=Streptomyces sp. JV178 TaxID=858632 RepID=UPI00211EF07D|nr:protein phosphatase 2C domain-containing protein [Streptomyces sp. JV178]